MNVDYKTHMGVQRFILSYYKKNNKIPDSLLLKGVFMMDIESDEVKESIKYVIPLVEDIDFIIDFRCSFNNPSDIKDRILARMSHCRYVFKLELYDQFYGNREESFEVINLLLNECISYDVSTDVGIGYNKKIVDLGDRYAFNPYYLDQSISMEIDNKYI